MELKEFLKYKNIVIQCHDNPDADALASGYALMWYFQQNDKKAKFIYRGRNEIKKSNLLIMCRELDVPVDYEPFFAEEPEIVIDCDLGAGSAETTVWTCDFTHEYISINGDYRS